MKGERWILLWADGSFAERRTRERLGEYLDGLRHIIPPLQPAAIIRVRLK